ncbi:TetR family transcriptional regulator [[Clostridium] leptum]|uniref:TetR family transcriptional regulator n=1 Tax=[Clostridium] leptum TaxID=1535 RepID=A0A412AT91_9FIRM|nr:TetR family transcriptional regulator [[Clostridium] leptum]
MTPTLRRATYGLIHKKLITTIFQMMLEELPFDRITVAALAKRADISPNIFYYHY